MSAAVGDDMVFLNPATDSYVAIDEVGRRVWQLLEQPRRFGDLIARLADEFDGTDQQIAADVSAFLDELGREGMIAISPAG